MKSELLDYIIKEGIIIINVCPNECCKEDKLVTLTEKYKKSLSRSNTRKGQKHNNAKLTEEDVKKIRERLGKGDLQKEIAEDFHTSASNISGINCHHNWKHIR